MCVNFHGCGPKYRTVDAPEESVWITQSEAARILDLLVDRRDTILTVDDGNKSDIDVLLPLLQERQLKATFFILTGRLNNPDYLCETDVVTLRAMGMEIGLHGKMHVPWRRLSEVVFKDEMLEASAVLREILGNEIKAAACPFGIYDASTICNLARAGIVECYTSDGGWFSSKEQTYARNSVGKEFGYEDVKSMLKHPQISAIEHIKRWYKRSRR